MAEQTISARIRSIMPGGIAVLALALLTALLWLPFGLKVGFTGDDWTFFHQVDAGTVWSSASPLRLFIPIPWIIAYDLYPGSFAGFNLFLVLMIFGKGCLVYGILRRLNAVTALAFAAAVLSILLPADTGIFYIGALTIHFAVFCYLAAFYLLLVYWNTGRLSAVIALWIAQVLCVGNYELAYPLVLVTPLALLLLSPKINRRLIMTTLLWGVIPLINALWYVLIAVNFPRAFQYQGSLVANSSITAILTSVFNIYKRHFIDGWFATTAPPYLAVGVLAGMVVFGVCFWLKRRERLAQHQPEREPSTASHTRVFALGGLAIIGLGVALYLPTSVRDETLRTFYFSSVGAALTLATVFWWAARRPLIFAVFVGIFAGIGTLRLLEQHQSYRDESDRQQAVLSALVEALPAVEPGSGIVVVDQTAEGFLTQTIHSAFYLEYTLPMLYQDYSLEAELCIPGEFGTDQATRCRFTEDGLVISSLRTFYFFRPYDHLIVVRYDGAFSVVDDLTPYADAPIPAYQPERLYKSDAALPSRIADLFGR